MKRISRLILTFAMLFIVVLTTACESNKPITKTFVLKQEMVTITETITYIKSEDKIIKVTKVTDAKMILKSEEAKKKVVNILNLSLANHQGINGLTATLDIQEDKYVQTVELDYENLDYEKAKQQIPGFEEVYGSNDLSMKNREAELIKQGFVEQK